MLKNLFLNLLSNIDIKLSYLKQDYLGLNLDLIFLINFILGFGIAVFYIIICFLLGKKIYNFIFKNKTNLNTIYLLKIAFGSLFFSTGIAILGFFSILKPWTIWVYLILIVLTALYPFNKIRFVFTNIFKSLLKHSYYFTKNKFVFVWVLLFIFIAILNLINPEIREDQYHVDFPKIYLEQQTIMIPPKEGLRVSASPLLSEMTYLVGIFLWSNQSARYIHFMFYLLSILVLFEFTKLKEYKFSIYTPILFVTAPVIIHETSSMYVDFQWIFFFLLSIYVLINNKNNNNNYRILLSGLLIGGMMASKLWTIIFIPVSILFIFIGSGNIYNKLKNILIFTIASLLIPFIWLLRSYLLTGSPLYPAFSSDITLENKVAEFSILNFFSINYQILNPLPYLNIYSPLFFLGIFLFLSKIKDNLKLISALPIFKYFILLFFLYLSSKYQFGRYLLGLYVLFIFVASIGIYVSIEKFGKLKYLINSILIVMFGYYLISSLLIIPYSIGIADKNKYLTRILSRDNSSYYDFGKKFDKYITKKDYVATYNIYGHYYANFKFTDINFIINRNNKDFNVFKKKNITKIFIKDYDMNTFCERIKLKNCDSSKYSLISSYNEFPNYYLYSIK